MLSMRASIVCSLVVAGVLAGAAVAADQRPVEPGGKIGGMRVVRGAVSDADENMWVACPVWITKPRKVHRSCFVPKTSRLFIGGAHAAPTRKQLDNDWKHQHWSLWVDGQPIDLPRFGTSDSHGQTPNGKPALFRNWKVILAHVPSGKHTIHYVIDDPSGVSEAILAITIG